MTLENAPTQFVTSVRVLFDVLDSQQNGIISLADVESKWNPEATKNLPEDVLTCLRTVTPPSGLLSFELFLAGLRMPLTQRTAGFDPCNQPPPKPIKPISLQPKPSASRQASLQLEQRNLQDNGGYGNPRTQKNFNQNTRSHSITNLAASEKTFGIPQQQSGSEMYRRAVPKRRDSARRHTLGHGVDDSMVRRSKMLQQERAVLVQGLQHLDKARDWFNKRLHEVDEKGRFANTNSTEQNTDQQQEKLNFEKLRIQELNQQLTALIEGKGRLLHMNLARPLQSLSPNDQASGEIGSQTAHAMQLLRAQNRMLTKEVSQKSERICQLEKDKATLIKDMFEMRSCRHPGRVPVRQYDESTLM